MARARAGAFRRRSGVALDRRPVPRHRHRDRDAAHLGEPLRLPRPRAQALGAPRLPGDGGAAPAPRRPGPGARTPRRTGGRRLGRGARPAPGHRSRDAGDGSGARRRPRAPQPAWSTCSSSSRTSRPSGCARRSSRTGPGWAPSSSWRRASHRWCARQARPGRAASWRFATSTSSRSAWATCSGRCGCRFEEQARGPLVVYATLPGELHGLGLQMSALVLTAAGCRGLYLGTDVPVPQIAALVRDLAAPAVALSISRATRGPGLGDAPAPAARVAAAPGPDRRGRRGRARREGRGSRS